MCLVCLSVCLFSTSALYISLACWSVSSLCLSVFVCLVCFSDWSVSRSVSMFVFSTFLSFFLSGLFLCGLFDCLSSLYFCLSVWSVCLFFWSVCLSFCLSFCLTVCLVCLSGYRSVYLSGMSCSMLYICLSVYQTDKSDRNSNKTDKQTRQTEPNKQTEQTRQTEEETTDRRTELDTQNRLTDRQTRQIERWYRTHQTDLTTRQPRHTDTPDKNTTETYRRTRRND